MLKLIFKLCLVFTYYETILYTRDLKTNHTPKIIPALDITVSTIDKPDYDLVAALKQPEDLDYITKRLALGEQCYIAKHKNQICGFQWIAPGKREITHEADVVHVPRNGVYFHDAFTVEQFRGKNILPYLTTQIFRQLENKDYHTALAIIYNDNYPSRKSFEKVGFKKAELIRHFVLRITGKKYTTRTSLLGRR